MKGKRLEEMGRLPVTNRERRPDLQRLGLHHQAIIRDSVIGLDRTALSEKYQVTPQTISNVLNSPLARAEAARLKESIENLLVEESIDGKKELERLQRRAIEVISIDLYSEIKSKGRTRVAFDVLDRTGLGKGPDLGALTAQNIQINYLIPKPGDDPEEFRSALEEIKRIKGREDAIEADFKEEVCNANG